MNWEKLLGLSIPITGMVLTVFLLFLGGLLLPKIYQTSEDVAVLKENLGRASADLKAYAKQLGEITGNFQNLEGQFTTVSKNLQTAQTSLSQSVADISVVRNDVKALDQKITSIEENLNKRFQQIDVQLTALNKSALGVDKVLDRRFSSFEKELMPMIKDLNKKVGEIHKTTARPPSKNAQ